MTDELEPRMREQLQRPTGVDAVREFLQTYVFDADLDQVKRVVRHMMKTNPLTIFEGLDGLDAILTAEQPPGLLSNLVSYDANRSLDDPSDVGARLWLEQLRAKLGAWTEAPPV